MRVDVNDADGANGERESMTHRALITGAGSGIGAECAKRFAEAGFDLMLVGRRLDLLESVAASLPKSSTIETLSCDVSDEAQVGKVFDTYGQVDVLVNSAGVALSAPVGRTQVVDIERSISINAIGSFLCIRGALRGMRCQKWGRIVNIASISGLVGAPYTAAYTMSKHAVVGLTKTVSAEASRFGITVNAVCPNYVDTPLTDVTREHISRVTGSSDDSVIERIVGDTPLGRLITPAEVADVVSFLTSDQASTITGQTIVLNG